MDDLKGRNLGRYRLVERIGHGVLGSVWRAYDGRADRDVAIRVLAAELTRRPGFHEQFEHEVRLLATLNHPNIVPVRDFGEEGDLAYMVMPLMTGGTLDERCGTARDLPEIRRLAHEIGGALQYAHAQGVVHRDLEPGNVRLDEFGHGRLADVGVASLLVAPGAGMAGEAIGSPRYASPEQACGRDVDHRADLYSFGVILYQLATGRLPFDGSTAREVLDQHAYEDPPPVGAMRPGLPVGLEAAIDRALAKAPGDRFPSAAAMLSAIEGSGGVGAGPGPGAVGAARPSPAASPSSGGRWVDGLAPVVACVLDAVEGTDLEDAELLRRRVDEHLAELAAKGFEEAELERALFPVCTWADERILEAAAERYPDTAARWLESPLQARRYGTRNGGEEFFQRMEELGPGEADLGEVYHLCLGLGFRGRYAGAPDVAGLERARHALRRLLAGRIPDLEELERTREGITPRLLEVERRAVPGSPGGGRWNRSAVVAGIGLAALACVIGIGVVAVVSDGDEPAAVARCGNGALDPSEECDPGAVGGCPDDRCSADCRCLPGPATAASDPRPVAERARAHLASVDCGAVEVSGVERGLLSIAGRVPDEAARTALLAGLEALDGVDAVRADLTLLPRPFCRAVEILERAGGDDLSIDLPRGCSSYEGGEELRIGVGGIRGPAYLQVDYLVADGTSVAHLLPGLFGEDHRQAGPTTVLAKAPRPGRPPPRLRVSEPFGLELVLAVASREPLLGRRPVQEPVEDYLTALRAGLDRADGLQTDYCVIRTRPGGAR